MGEYKTMCDVTPGHTHLHSSRNFPTYQNGKKPLKLTQSNANMVPLRNDSRDAQNTWQQSTNQPRYKKQTIGAFFFELRAQSGWIPLSTRKALSGHDRWNGWHSGVQRVVFFFRLTLLLFVSPERCDSAEQEKPMSDTDDYGSQDREIRFDIPPRSDFFLNPRRFATRLTFFF